MTNASDRDEAPSLDFLHGASEQTADVDHDPPPWTVAPEKRTQDAPAASGGDWPWVSGQKSEPETLGRSDTARKMEQSGAIDDLSLRKALLDHEEKKSSRDKALGGWLGSVGLLNAEEAAKAAQEELKTARDNQTWWGQTKAWYEAKRAENAAAGDESAKALREGLTENGSRDVFDAISTVASYDPMAAAARWGLDELSRKMGKNIKDAKERAETAEEIIAGKKDPFVQSVWRNMAERTVQGTIETLVADTVKAVGYGVGMTEYGAGLANSSTDNVIYAAGDSISKWVKTAFPGDEARQHEWASKIGQGAGSAIGFFGPALGAKVVAQAGPRALYAVSAGRLGSSVTTAEQAARAAAIGAESGGILGAMNQSASMADDYTEKMQKEGKPVNEGARLALLIAGLPIGYTEKLSIDSMFSRQGGSIARGILEQIIEEGGQEFVQQVLENVAVKHLYDPDRHWDDNAWEGMAVGSILGGAMGGGAGLYEKWQARKEGKAGAEFDKSVEQSATKASEKPSAPADASIAPAADGASAVPPVTGEVSEVAKRLMEEARAVDPEFAAELEKQIGGTQEAKVRIKTKTDESPAGVSSESRDVMPMLDGESQPGEVSARGSTTTTGQTQGAIPEEVMAILRQTHPEAAKLIDDARAAKPDTNISTTNLMYSRQPGQEGSPEKLIRELLKYGPDDLRKIAKANNLEVTADGKAIADVPDAELVAAIVSATQNKHRQRNATAEISPTAGMSEPDREGPEYELRPDVDEALPATSADIDQYLADTDRMGVDLSDDEYRRITASVLDGVNLDDAVEQTLSIRDVEPVADTPIATETAEKVSQPAKEVSQPAEQQPDQRGYNAFAEMLAGKTPASKWASQMGVDQATIDGYVQQALLDGRLAMVAGKPRRTPKAKLPIEAEPDLQDGGPAPQTAAPAKAAKPAGPTLTRAEEKRLEAVKDDLSYAYAKRLLDVQADAAQFGEVLQAISGDKRVNKERLKQLFRAYTGSRTAPKTRPKAVSLMAALRDERAKIAEKKANAERSRVRESEGSVPEGSVPVDQGSDAVEGNIAAAPSDGGVGRAGDVRGSDSADAEQAGPADGVSREGDGVAADTGSGPGDREQGTDTRPPDLGLTPEQRAEIQAKADADADAYEAKRQARMVENYTITDADKIGQGGAKAKVRGNLEAIRIIRQIEQEGGRPATVEEKAKLVKYVGWGAFAQDVFTDYKSEWAKERNELKDLLSPEEYAAARASVTNAHYTSPEVIKGMWDALKHIGFEGGRVLEPSAGIGHFIGLQPESMKADTDWTAVELDKISGAITKALYGAADVRIGGFEDQTWPDDHFDLAISNVPFAKQGPHDPRYKTKFSLHDYFFVKALDKVRPGGIVAFITSNYSLDKQRDTARREMEKRATFLGAVRLPGGSQGAFKANAGTDVTTDIIFLRKRIEGEPSQTGAAWTNLADIKTPEGPTKINAYFAEKPDMMLGKMRLTGTMYGRGQPVLIGSTEGIENKIVNAVSDNIPAGSMIPRGIAAADMVRDDLDTQTDGIKEGSFYEKDGTLYRKIVGVGVPQKLNKKDDARVRAFMPIRDNITTLLAKQASGDKAGMDDLRADLNKAYDAFVKQFGPINLTHVTETTRKKDGKVITTRRLPNFSVLMDDTDAYTVSAIELYDEKTGKATKAAIFKEDVVAPYVRPAINDPADAIGVSLNEKGRVDLPTIAQTLGVSEPEAIAALGDKIYLNPKGERWQTRAQYLSGDVVTKLEEARAAAQTNRAYARNVAALEAVQPVPLTRAEITIPLGASWVPGDIYNDFIRDVIGARRMTVSLNEITKRWRVDPNSFPGADAVSQWGTDRVEVADIVEAAFNSTPIMVWDKHHDGTRTRNEEAEAQARAKIQAIREAFSGQVFPGSPAAVGGWVWKDEERAQRLEDGYNRALNRIVKEQHDGSHLTFPGLARTITFPDGASGTIDLNPARTAAVWRIIQNGNTLIDHVVGAGKTWTSIMAVMEMKRLGQIRRPMFVVPNHMLHQFSHEFLQAYPGAKLLIATKEGMSAERRREFAAKAASEKWDGIIITHSAFGRLRMKDEAYQAFFRDQIEALVEAKIQATVDEGKDSPTVKDMEKAKKALQSRLDKLVAKDKKDYGITFEELGVDHLTVDEAHLFKNLSFPTRHTRVRGISNKSESQRATDLFIKIQHLEASRPGRSTLFLTGTPLSNTMAEVYTMMRYLMMPKLKEYGIAEFDSWAQTFGMIDTKSELSPDGKGYRDTTSFSTFVNVPELSTLYGQIADTQTAESLKLPRPTLKDGKATLVESELAFDERAALERIFEDMAKLKGTKPEKGQPNFLSLFTKGMQIATDMRLVNPDAAFNPTGKIGKALNNIYRIWEQGNADPAAPNKAQVVFLDMGVPGSKAAAVKPTASESAAPTGLDDSAIDKIRKKMIDDGDLDQQSEGEIEEENKDEETKEAEALLIGKFNLYADMKKRLVEMGVPAEQIAFIHDAKTDEAKGKLFDAVREGKVRVLIGSTSKMGVGTNVQKRLIALHHIDAPWRPADLEQRDGRILRRGNKNAEVQIFRYITTRSLDAYKWQVLDTKSNFIGQFRAGARGVRIAEDIDMPLPDAAQVKAAATGDPRFQEQADLSRSLRQLEAQAMAHASTSVRARSSLERLTGMRASLSEKLPAFEADAALVTDLSGDNFKITIDGDGDYTDRKKAGTAVRDLIVKTAAGMWGSRSAEIKIGKISGLEANAFVRRTSDGIVVTAEVRGAEPYESAEFSVTEEANPVALIQRFERLVREPVRLLGETRSMLATIDKDIPKLEKSAVSTPFAKQPELVITRARLADLGAQLDPKKAEARAEMAYVDQAMTNLKKTSRTAAGVVDTSASAGKAEQMAEGLTPEKAATAAADNLQRAMREAFAKRNQYGQMPTEQLSAEIDKLVLEINKGILKPGALYRLEDGKKYPYTAVANLNEAHRQFVEEFKSRLSDPNADPVETAAWVEWRANLTDHFWADGVGKTSKVLAAIPLMQAGLPLPKYRDNKEMFAYSQPQPYVPNPDGSTYRDGYWERFLEYYRTLMPSMAQAELDKRERKAREIMASPEWTQATIPDMSRDTQKQPGFGTPEWREARTYNTPEGEIVGYENGIDYLIRSAHAKVDGGVKAERKVFILLGMPGAGKSTIAKRIGEKHGAVHYVGDDAKLIIPEYDGGNNSGGVHEEASDMMKDVIDRQTSSGVNIIVEKLGSSDGSIMKMVDKFAREGYKVIALNVDVPKALAMERAIGRWQRTGRAVPINEFDKTALNLPGLMTRLQERENVDETGKIAFSEARDRWELASEPTVETQGLWDRPGASEGDSGVDGVDRGPGNPGRSGRGGGETREGSQGPVTPGLSAAVAAMPRLKVHVTKPNGSFNEDVEADARDKVRAALKAGYNVVISPAVVKRTNEVLSEVASVQPDSIAAGTVSKMRNIGNGGVRIIVSATDGRNISLDMPGSFFFREDGFVRAFHIKLPLNHESGAASLIAVFNHTDDAVVGSQLAGLRATHVHELVHSLYGSGKFGVDLWKRLVDHAYRSGALEMGADRMHEALGLSPTDDKRSMQDIYYDLYTRQGHHEDVVLAMLDQEAVAHFAELASHGFWSEDELAPVKDILEAIQDGSLANGKVINAQPDAVMAAIDAAGVSQRKDFDALGFYSQALEAAKRLKQAKGTPEQMLAQLKAAGVKEAEISATGLGNFLAGQKSVTRDEIVKHLEENRVGLTEKQYGANLTALRDAEAKRLFGVPFSQLRDAARINAVGEAIGTIEQPLTKWSNYSLDPSNPTYRETVLHLPANDMRPSADILDTIDQLAAIQERKPAPKTVDFRSGHFSEPNIIGHMMTSMTQHQSKPVFTIDQIQSDWGQKIRDADPESAARTRQALAEFERQNGTMQAILDRRDAAAREILSAFAAATKGGLLPSSRRQAEALRRAVGGARDVAADRGQQYLVDADRIAERLGPAGSSDVMASAPKELRDAIAAYMAERRLIGEHYRIKAEADTAKAAPTTTHPLVNTTDQWTTTTLRHALRQAVAAGAEYIAIPSGDTVLSYNPGDVAGMRGFYGGKARPDLMEKANKAWPDRTQMTDRQRRELADIEAMQTTTEGIVPKNLRKLLEKMDKSIKPQRIDTLDSPSGKKNLGKGFTLFPITPAVREHVEIEGLPMFAWSSLFRSASQSQSQSDETILDKQIQEELNGNGVRARRELAQVDVAGGVADAQGEGSAEGRPAEARVPGSREAGDEAGNADLAGSGSDWVSLVESIKGHGWMRQESIAQRQRAQGFTTKGWHATTADFEVPSARRRDFGFHVALGSPAAANYRAGTPSTAIDRMNFLIAEGRFPGATKDASIMPVMVKAENTLRLNDPGRWVSPADWSTAVGNRKGPVYDALRAVVAKYADETSSPGGSRGRFLDEIAAVLDANDIDAAIYKNRIEALGRDSLFVWKPENVRSQFDLFDERADGEAGLHASRKHLEQDMNDMLDGLIEETVDTMPRRGMSSEQALKAMLDPVAAPALFAVGGKRTLSASERAEASNRLREKADEKFAGQSAPALNKIITDLKGALGMVTTQGLWGVTVRQETDNADGSKTVREKRLRPSSRMRAMFRPRTGVVSLRMSRDISAIAHEGGHGLEQAIGVPLEALKVEHRAELEPLAYAGATDTLSEGFAEWFKAYIVDRDGADLAAPNFFQAFEDLIDAEKPGLLPLLIEVQSAYAAHIKKDPDDALAADLVSTYENNTWRDLAADGSFENVSGKLSTAYTATVDALNPINKLVRKLLEVADENGVRDKDGKPISLAVHENPYKLARLFADAYSRGRMWLENGIANYGETIPQTKGIHDALTIAMKGSKWDKRVYQRLGAYLVSRRAIAEYDLLAKKTDELAQIDATLKAAETARPTLVAARDSAEGKRDRRDAQVIRESAILQDRRRQLANATTAEDIADLEYDIQERELALMAAQSEAEIAAKAANAARERLARVDQLLDRANKERARRAEMGASRPPTLQPKAYHEEVVSRLEAKHPEFKAASKIIYDWTHQLLTVRYQAGFLTKEQYDAFSLKKGFYVPFMRDMTDVTPEAAFGDKGPKKWSPFKKFDGSDRAIINPLEALSRSAYTTAQQIAFNDVMKSLRDLAQVAGKGAGQIIEPLTQKDWPVGANPDTFRQIYETATSLGIDPADAHQIVQSMEMNFSDADVQLIWSPENKGPGSLPVLPMWENGERVLLRLNDPVFGKEVFDAVNGLGKEGRGLIDQIMGAFSTGLRLGVTTHPDFALRNLLRDIPAMFIVAGATPGVAHARGLKALWSNSEMAQIYNQVGGIMGGANVAATRKAKDQADVAALANKGFHILDWRRPWHVIEAVETAGRLGVFAHAYKQALKYNPNLTQLQAAQEAAYVARDVIDFGRRGSKAAGAMRVVTFMNAHVQSMDKAARLFSAGSDRGSVFKKHVAVAMKMQNATPLSKQEERMQAEAVKAFVRLAIYTAFLLAIYGMMKDDREYQDIKDQTKHSHAWFKLFGTWFRMPTAFEFAMPAMWAEIVLDKMAGRNDQMVKRLASSAADTLVPPMVPQAINLFTGVAANYDLFRKRPIVGEQLQGLDPSQQFDAYASKLAVDLAHGIEKTGLPRDKVPSPKLIDFLLTSGGAYWGKEAQNAWSLGAKMLGKSNRESWQWTDAPMIRGLTGEPARQSRSSDEFWKLAGSAGGSMSSAAKTYSNFIKVQGQPEAAAAYLSRLEPEERAYAYLMETGSSEAKAMHPIERLRMADATIRSIRKDMILDTLTPKNKKGKRDFDEKIRLSPDKQTEVQSILEKLGAMEAWNTMTLLKRPGFENGKIFDPRPLEETLRASNNDVYELLQSRRAAVQMPSGGKVAMPEWRDVEKNWPKMREQLLKDAGKAL